MLAALATACAGDAKTATTDSAATATVVPAIAPVITISARDFSYDAPDTIAAGMVTLRLVNNGPELHHVQLIRIGDGKSYADLQEGLKTMKPGAPLPPWLVEIAGPNSPVPGGEQSLTQDMPAGNYAIICAIPSTDGVPHMMKGMMKALTVVPASGASAPAPAADITVSMTDYAWEVTPAITAGKHVIKLENVAEQAHEMFIIQLAPGKNAGDFLTWFEKQNGPPPATPMGGISGMVKGTVAYLPVDLPPGEYALLCFLPDAKDGRMHLAHGMVKQITVQ